MSEMSETGEAAESEKVPDHATVEDDLRRMREFGLRVPLVRKDFMMLADVYHRYRALSEARNKA